MFIIPEPLWHGMVTLCFKITKQKETLILMVELQI